MKIFMKNVVINIIIISVVIPPPKEIAWRRASIRYVIGKYGLIARAKPLVSSTG